VEISEDLQKGKSLLLVGAMVGTSYRSHIDCHILIGQPRRLARV